MKCGGFKGHDIIYTTINSDSINAHDLDFNMFFIDSCTAGPYWFVTNQIMFHSHGCVFDTTLTGYSHILQLQFWRLQVMMTY
jgi:hypothetical protein